MAKRKYPMNEWASNPANAAAVLAAVDAVRGDGHAIYDPAAFPTLPEDVKALYTTAHASDPISYKSTITRADGSTGDVGGIYGLSLIEGIASALGLDSFKQGRGSRCRDLSEQIRRALSDVKIEQVAAPDIIDSLLYGDSRPRHVYRVTLSKSTVEIGALNDTDAHSKANQMVKDGWK